MKVILKYCMLALILWRQTRIIQLGIEAEDKALLGIVGTLESQMPYYSRFIEYRS